MGRFGFRKLVSYVLLFMVPASVFAADTHAAMLYTNGTAWVNGAHVPRASSSIFSGDLLQTRSDTVANINQSGSSIMVLSDSLVQFEGSSLKIEHGGVTVSTSRGIAAVAGDVSIAPASDSWTEFNVIDTDGTVRIAARKGDLTIRDGNGTSTLAQGQETTRDESSGDSDKSGKKKNGKHGANASPGATGGLLNSPLAVGLGAAAVAGVGTWVIVKSGSPASPSKP